jgi:putative molybdopterin biosynthesis protein
MSKTMLTTKDLAEYLRINENQIYRMIKEKKLPATRVTGKWLFPKELIDEWVNKSARESIDGKRERASTGQQIVIAGSNDLALELLAKSANIQNPRLTISLTSVGSHAGLVALRNGSCHVAATHLLDAETGEYNGPTLKKSFFDLKVTLLNLAHREQGLVVMRGNPLGLRNYKDLANKRALFINRQEGSGTRVLLDYGLKENEINPTELVGYERIAFTHMEVALAVLNGTADVGIAIRATAKLLGLDFIPLTTERFDLVIPNEIYSTRAVRSLCKVLNSDEFKSNVLHMGGYETYDTGRIMYEQG